MLAALAFTIVLWFLHNGNREVWTTTMVVSLTPLLLAVRPHSIPPLQQAAARRLKWTAAATSARPARLAGTPGGVDS